MFEVLIDGWLDERNPQPISLVHCMRRHAGLSLTAAKQLLDDFAEHGQVRVPFYGAEQARDFIEEAHSIGAKASSAQGA